MSKSLKRVEEALHAGGVSFEMREMDVESKTAQQAADAAGVDVNQIAKSIIVNGVDSGDFYLFITAGGNQVNSTKAIQLAGEMIAVPDAAAIRQVTGFAIGGVAPVGHLTPIKAFLDPLLMAFPTVWAAGGTPRHIFEVSPFELIKLTNATVSDFTPDDE